ncbi:MAG: S9 family peptidase, partial [Elusimicrobiota bacterium]
DAPERILLDVNTMAEGHAYFEVKSIAVSPDHDMIAFAVDAAGDLLHTIRFKDLGSGEVLPDSIVNAEGSMDWANDNKTLFYARQDTTTMRSDAILRHVLGSGEDALVYFEPDDTFAAYVHKSRSREFMVIGSFSTLTSEYRLLRADDPEGTPRVFHPRRTGHEYYISHGGDRFYIRTNDRARNFSLMETPEDRTGMENWTEAVPHSKDILLEGVEAFEGHVVLQEKEGGLTRFGVIDRETRREHHLEFYEPAYSARLGDNPEYETRRLRFVYESMTTPDSTYDYDMDTKRKELRKRKEVPGGFKPEDYKSERIFARAPDGARVPISLVYRRGMRRDGENPAVLNGYGAYGDNNDPAFDSDILSLLDRGFIYALAHIRGGSEMGRYWYEDGRQMKKRNTFTDFIACSEHLIKEGYTSSGHLYAAGASAGGLLMGAVLNMRPDLYNGALVDVPFVDALTAMLDASIPLTTSEYDEWGNPNEKAAYDYIKSYSPYDNVKAQAYPNILVTTGLNDSQVQYWEPAKWVAKLRRLKTGRNRLLLKTEMGSGHAGASGRFERLKLFAFQYAFLLDLEGITQ